MSQILLSIIALFSFSFIEPFMYFAFGISSILILSYGLFSKRIRSFSIILISVIAIILDITLKFPIGSHLLSVVIALGIWYGFDRFIPANIPFFEFGKLVISFAIALFVLKCLKSSTFSISYLSSTIIPAFFSAILAVIFGLIFSQFGTNNSLNKLKIK